MEQDRGGRGQVLAVGAALAAVDSEKAQRQAPAKGKAEAGAGVVTGRAVGARATAGKRKNTNRDRSNDNASRKWNGAPGNGANDRSRSRFLRGIWNAGIHESGSRSRVRHGVWTRARGSRLWRRPGVARVVVVWL